MNTACFVSACAENSFFACLRRGTRSFWMTLAILFMTGMVFVGVYMFIKVTSWSGYSAARAVRRAAAAQEL